MPYGIKKSDKKGKKLNILLLSGCDRILAVIFDIGKVYGHTSSRAITMYTNTKE